jgi:hypothetical protein
MKKKIGCKKCGNTTFLRTCKEVDRVEVVDNGKDGLLDEPIGNVSTNYTFKCEKCGAVDKEMS